MLAALDLFVENGYEETTVAEIARRAGLTKSTFFRHFADKREVLFIGQDTLGELFATGIANAPSAATPLGAVTGALEASAAAFPSGRRTFARRRRAVIAAHPELQEREARKRIGFAEAMTQALVDRRVDEPAAALAAQYGVLAFSRALARWTEPGAKADFAGLARKALDELQTVGATLG
jgi:AcrR family transcriptional regulator